MLEIEAEEVGDGPAGPTRTDQMAKLLAEVRAMCGEVVLEVQAIRVLLDAVMGASSGQGMWGAGHGAGPGGGTAGGVAGMGGGVVERL